MHTTSTTRPRHAPPRRRRAARLGLVAGAVAALTVLPALPAAAHDELVSATPAAGAVVTAAPGSVRLAFSGDLLELGGGRNLVSVVDAAGRHYETACAVVDGDTMTSPVALGAAGAYTVDWAALSGDGHPVADSYTFTWRPAAGTAAAAAGSANGPACGSGGTTTAATPAATAATGLPGGALVTGAIAGGVLLAAVAAVLVVVVRLRRAPGEEEGR